MQRTDASQFRSSLKPKSTFGVRASKSALTGGVLMALLSAPNAAMATVLVPAGCVALPTAPAGYALGYTCTGTFSSPRLNIDDTHWGLVGAGTIFRRMGAAALTLNGTNNFLSIGDGTNINSNYTGGSALLLDGSDDTKILVKKGGLIDNTTTGFSDQGIQLQNSKNVTISIEQGGTIRVNAGAAIQGGNLSTGVSVFNSGTMESTFAGASPLISFFGAKITNEATGVMTATTTARPMIELNGGGSLTNHGMIENKGSGIAVSGDGDGPAVDVVVNSGTIKTAGTVAIDMKGGDDTLELQPGSVIVGTVTAGAGTDTLRFGGSGAASFGLDSIGAGKQYRDFEIVKVTNGEWSFTGATTNDFTVENGIVKGTGTFGNLTFTGGTFAPGNSIGTINVAGNLVLGAGSTYEAEVNAAGQSDLIAVTGTTTITGATLSIKGEAGTYSATTPTYTILTSAGGVTGTFGTVTDDLPDLDFAVEYRSNDVRLSYSKIVTAGPTATATSPKEILSSSIAGAGIADILFRTTVTGSHNGSSSKAQRLSFDGLTLSTKNAQTRNWTVWTAAVGQKVNVGTNAGLLGWDASIGGGILGIDAAPDWGMPIIATAALGYTNTQTTAGTSSSNVGTTHLGLAASLQTGAWTIDGGLSFGKQSYSNTRIIPVGATTRTASGSTTGTSVGINLNSYYDLASGRNASARSSLSYGPVIGFDWFQTKQAGYSETGAGVLNLDVASSTSTQASARLGMAGSVRKVVNGANVTFDGLLAFERNLGDRSVTTIATLPVTGQQFTTQSAPVGLNRAVIGLGASIELGANTTAYVSYEGRLDRVSSDHSAAIGISWKF